MLRKISLLFITFIATLLISSCIVTSHDYNITVSCEQFAGNSIYNDNLVVEVGDKIRLELCSNHTTGFQWDYEFTTEGILQEEDHDFEEPTGKTGAAGIELWTFEAINKGTTDIQMEYSQPWEGGSKAQWTCNISVMVE